MATALSGCMKLKSDIFKMFRTETKTKIQKYGVKFSFCCNTHSLNTMRQWLHLYGSNSHKNTQHKYYCLCGLIVRVRVVPRRTVVGDIYRRFDNLSGSHHQSHVNCVSSVYVGQCHQQQSFSGLLSPGRSNHTND